MVLPSPTPAGRFAAPREPFYRGGFQMVQFTRRDVEALLRVGIIPEDATTELLFGLIVLKDRSACGQDLNMVGRDHTKVVEQLSDLRSAIKNGHRHVRSPQPLMCSETHLPVPDFFVVRGTLDDYADLPTAADAWVVVEVADSSYERDAGVKLEGYARAVPPVCHYQPAESNCRGLYKPKFCSRHISPASYRERNREPQFACRRS